MSIGHLSTKKIINLVDRKKISIITSMTVFPSIEIMVRERYGIGCC